MNKKGTISQDLLRYFDGDLLAAGVWQDKYALKNKQGEILERTPDNMHHRLAKEFARIEQKYPNSMSEEEIYELLKDFKYIVPQGSPMAGIGNDESITSLSNCFVIGNNDNSDSYGSIFRTDEEQVQLMKRRGGVGHDLSHLRPSGAMANNSILTGVAGSTLYMERYSNSTREVSQGDRRGALMLSISVKHPDADKFIDMKLTKGKVTGANVSVKLTDDFMDCVRREDDFWQTFPIDLKIPLSEKSGIIENLKYNELTEIAGGYIKVIKAKELWDKIIHNAWKSAEPGILFWDTILNESIPSCYGKEWKELSTNPCGEVPLNEYDSCRLLLLNLYSYVEHPFTMNAYFNYDLFEKHSYKAQRLMDDLVDLEIEKIEAILDKIKNDKESEEIKYVEYNLWLKVKEKAEQGRRTGLGITGEGDMLAALGLTYGTQGATDFAVEVHKHLAVESYKSSIDLAEQRGCFSIWDKDKELNNPFIDRIYSDIGYIYRDKYIEFGRRNIANLTIAPAGSVSICTQTTSGIEPCFQPYYIRRRKTNIKEKAVFTDDKGDMWEEYLVFHHKFAEWYIITNHFTEDRERAKEVLLSFNKEELQQLVELSPYHKATANDIDWVAKVEMQGAIQQWVDHSISCTVNLPKIATIETVEKVYMKAWESGCKGVTVYRDGCRDGVLLTETKKENFNYIDSLKRPKIVEVDIYHKTALKKYWMILIGLVDNKPIEIFTIPEVSNGVFHHAITKGTLTKIKSKVYKLKGNFEGKEYVIENITQLMTEEEQVDTRKYSLMLRHFIHPKYIYNQIEEYAVINSFDRVVQKVLKNYIKDEEMTVNKCPECGENMVNEGGCVGCKNCGYQKCG